MNKIILFTWLLIGLGSDTDTSEPPEQYITRQGQVSFFSYTSVENIEASNNQVLSIIDFSKNEIAVSMLMNAFVFEKSLMHMHFNESYIESDLYPKATFEGRIIDFNPDETALQTKIIKGALSIHGITRDVEIKTSITRSGSSAYLLEGNFEVAIKDFDIKVPPVLEPNIAKTIAIQFRFEYDSYEK